MFQDAAPDMPVLNGVIVTLLYLAQLVASIWAIVIFVVTLSEVQGFSVLKAILNIIITCLIFIVLGWLLNMIAIGIQS
jgi:hypothetical protein